MRLDCDIARMTVWQCAAAYLSGSVGADLSVTYLLRNAEEHKGSHEAFNVLAINSLQLARTEAINLNYNSRQADTCSHTPTHARTHTQTHADTLCHRQRCRTCRIRVASCAFCMWHTFIIFSWPPFADSLGLSPPSPLLCLPSLLFILIHASGKGINRAGHKDARGCQSCC